jgi:hypothetical protein
MALQIAHQGAGRPVSVRRGDPLAIRIPSQKNSHGPLPHSISFPFPKTHAGSCLVDRRAMPPLTWAPERGAEETARENSVDSVDSM